MTAIAFDYAKFGEMFPEFSTLSEQYVQFRWDIAICYVSDENYGCLSGTCRENVLLYVTAHIIQIENATRGESGAEAGVITSASIDKISVTVQAPPNADKSAFAYWLNKTPYGQNALALLKSASVGGLYIGGLPERSAFRKVGGIF